MPDDTQRPAEPSLPGFLRALPPSGSVPPAPVALRHQSLLAQGVSIELGQAKGGAPLASLVAGSTPGTLRLSVTGPLRYMRLLIDLPTAAEARSSRLFFRARLRAPDGAPPCQLGLVEATQHGGWRWTQEKPRRVDLGSGWQDVLTCWQDLPADTARLRLVLQCNGPVMLDIGEVTLAMASDDGPALAEGPWLIQDLASNGIVVSLSVLTYWLADGRLAVRARLAANDDRLLAFAEVICLADDQPLQAGQLRASGDGMWILALDIVCSRRTGQRRLRLLLVDAGLTIHLPPPDSLPPDLPPPLLPEGGLVEGALEGVRRRERGLVVSGWARDPAQPEAALRVDLFADDEPLASVWANGRHRDLTACMFGAGRFSLTLPANFARGRRVLLRAAPRARAGKLDPETISIRLPPHGVRIEKPGARAISGLDIPLRPQVAHPRAAAVILTEDGADLLEPMLESLLRVEPRALGRIIIIDHESTDNTPELAARYARLLPVEHVIRPRGTSFAASCNHGAALCEEAEVLVFLNNDLIFVTPVLAAMIGEATAERGVVGARLLDDPAPGGPDIPQHLGVHFQATGSAIRPFETRVQTDAPPVRGGIRAVPCVTGAMMALHRESFTALGGFDEGYHYGAEDVDLCLRALAAGRSNLVLQDSRTQHLHGRSRGRMNPAARLLRAGNWPRFDARWGYALRRALREALRLGNGFWHGRRVTIGFVLAEHGAGANGDEWPWAEGLMKALALEFPCDLYGFRTGEPIDATDIDLLLVFDPACDPRRVAGLGGCTLVLACAHGQYAHWAGNPGREVFAAWFAAADAGRDYLAEETGRRVSVLPSSAPLAAARLLGRLRDDAAGGLRVAIKVGLEPELLALAEALRPALECLGHAVRIELPEAWYGPVAAADDAVIALPGAERYQPHSSQVSLLWVAGDYDRLSLHEVRAFAAVHVASQDAAEPFMRWYPGKLPFLPLPDLAAGGMDACAAVLDAALLRVAGTLPRLPMKLSGAWVQDAPI